MLEFIIFASGALIMVLEMVGARVMAPHLGTSVIIWTSLIGVILACLAVGAFLGGRLADKKLSQGLLAKILGAAGLGVALTALLHAYVGAFITASIDNIYVSAVLATICLFAFPAVFFGMVSPYVIRLRLADISTSGATVGRLYALSTTGSILGTFLGGFVLVSFFSSTHILLGTSGGMLLLSLLASLQSKSPKSDSIPAVFLIFCLPFIAYVNQMEMDKMRESGMLSMVETPYNSIRLSQGLNEHRRPIRLMTTGPGYAQSGMYLDKTSELLFDYTKYYALGTVLFPEAKSVLMLGGGGYSVPKWLLAGYGGLDGQSLRLDVVELDAGMTRLAKKFFSLQDDARMQIFHADARRFINVNTSKYDLVFVDVFNSHYSVPFHMGTVEAAKAMRRAVNDYGSLMMNVISAVEGESSYVLQGIYGALKQEFAKVYVFSVQAHSPRTSVQNLMLLALPSKNSHVENLIESNDYTEFSENVQQMLAARVLEPIAHDVPPLQDDFAPVEKYAQALLKK